MQYEFLLWLRLVLLKNDIDPHGNLPGAYFMQQYRNTALAERWYNRLRALIQENLTAFPAKYPLYDVELWSKTKRAAIAALFFYHNPLISRPDGRPRICNNLYFAKK